MWLFSVAIYPSYERFPLQLVDHTRPGFKSLKTVLSMNYQLLRLALAKMIKFEQFLLT